MEALDDLCCEASKRSRLVTHPHHFPVLLVGAAVLQGATHFDLKLDRTGGCVSFDGRPLDADTLRGLSNSTQGAQHYLLRAIQCLLLRQEMKTISVQSGQDFQVVRGPRSTHKSEAQLSTRVDFGERWSLGRLFSSPDKLPEVEILKDRCRWAPLQIRYNGQLLNDRSLGSTIEVGAVEVKLCWFEPESSAVARIYLLDQGIHYGPFFWDLDLPGCVAVLNVGSPPKDQSLLVLVGEQSWMLALKERVGEGLRSSYPERVQRAVGLPPESWLLKSLPAKSVSTLLSADGSRLVLVGSGQFQVREPEQLVAQQIQANWSESKILEIDSSGLHALIGGEEAVLVRLLDGAELSRLPCVRAAAFHPDGGTLACGWADGTVSLHRVPDGAQLARWSCEAWLLRWHPSGKWLVTCSFIKGSLTRWSDSGTRLGQLEGKVGALNLDFSPAGDLMSFCGRLYRCPDLVEHLALESSKMIEINGEMMGISGSLFSAVLFLGGGETFAGCLRFGAGVEIRQSISGQVLGSFEDANSTVVSADRTHLALWNQKKRVRIVDSQAQLLDDFPMDIKPEWVDSRWIGGGHRLLSWKERKVVQFGPRCQRLDRLEWNDQELLLVGGGSWRLGKDDIDWSLEATQELSRTPAGVQGGAVGDRLGWLHVVRRPDGKLLAGADENGRVTVVNVELEKVVVTFQALDEAWVLTSPDGYWTASAWTSELLTFRGQAVDPSSEDRQELLRRLWA